MSRDKADLDTKDMSGRRIMSARQLSLSVTQYDCDPKMSKTLEYDKLPYPAFSLSLMGNNRICLCNRKAHGDQFACQGRWLLEAFCQ